MLSKTFKSAEELGVPADFYDALVQVYWMLVDETIPNNLFNMACIGNPKLDTEGHLCGTAGCLLGWTIAVGKMDLRAEIGFDGPHPDIDDKREIVKLFYPGRGIKGGYNGTRAQSAVALNSYLTTGSANWAEALKG